MTTVSKKTKHLGLYPLKGKRKATLAHASVLMMIDLSEKYWKISGTCEWLLMMMMYQIDRFNMSHFVRKPAFCICENKDADQLRGNRKADQRLCFRYTDSTIPLLPKSNFQASSHLLCLYSLVCVGPGRKPRRPVFSQRGSYKANSLASLFGSKL